MAKQLNDTTVVSVAVAMPEAEHQTARPGGEAEGEAPRVEQGRIGVAHRALQRWGATEPNNIIRLGMQAMLGDGAAASAPYRAASSAASSRATDASTSRSLSIPNRPNRNVENSEPSSTISGTPAAICTPCAANTLPDFTSGSSV